MISLLRFNGTSLHDPAIDAWLASRPPELGALATEWFAEIRRCGSAVHEVMHDGCPTGCVEDAGFAYVNVFTKHVNVGFFQGASLPDPTGLLQGSGKYMRHVKLHPGVAYDAQALRALVTAAYSDIVTKLAREATARGAAKHMKD
ncbi:MAG: DUF1801 domain-containing protein [Pirellulales bacterium]